MSHGPMVTQMMDLVVQAETMMLPRPYTLRIGVSTWHKLHQELSASGVVQGPACDPPSEHPAFVALVMGVAIMATEEGLGMMLLDANQTASAVRALTTGK